MLLCELLFSPLVREGFLEEVSFELRLKDWQQKQNMRKNWGVHATEWIQHGWQGAVGGGRGQQKALKAVAAAKPSG